MQLIATKAGPSDKYDRLRCVRDDGSETTVAMPRQGTLPHDLVHAVVESALGFSDGFIGLVAKGADIAFLSKSFHEYIDPVRHAQGAQAESAVESLQSQLWSGVFDEGAFRYGLETACAMRGVAVPDLAGIDLAKVGRISADLAPEVDLHTGTARSVLRRRVLAAQAGGAS